MSVPQGSNATNSIKKERLKEEQEIDLASA